MRQIYLILLVFLSFSLSVRATQDVVIVRDYSNVKLKITTLTELYGQVQMAEVVGKWCNKFIVARFPFVKEKVLLQFEHEYTKIKDPIYRVSVGTGVTSCSENWDEYFLERKGLVIKVEGSFLNAREVIKLLDYGMRNLVEIEKNQKDVGLLSYSEAGQCTDKTIDLEEMESVLKSKHTENVLFALGKTTRKYFNQLPEHCQGFHLVLSNDKYQVQFSMGDEAITLNNIYMIHNQCLSGALVFDSDSSFFYYNYAKKTLSQRKIIKKTIKGFTPPFEIFGIDYDHGKYYMKYIGYDSDFNYTEGYALYLAEYDTVISYVKKID